MNFATTLKKPLLLKKILAYRRVKWAFAWLCLCFFIATFSNIISNNQYIYCQVKGKSYFPIFQTETMFRLGDTAQAATNKLLPLIPYSAERSDVNNQEVSPFAVQDVVSWRYRHWFGTYERGKDVLAGVVAGTRVALLVGILSVALALLIGIFLGALAGYFANNTLKISRAGLIMFIFALPLSFFYGFIARQKDYIIDSFYVATMKGIMIFLMVWLLAWLLSKLLKKVPFLNKSYFLPLDTIIMRLVELKYAIPIILLLITLLRVVDTPSIGYVILIIAFIEWTTYARYFRAELLRIRNLEYIEAARGAGFSEWRILWHHAMPNAIMPLLVQVIFGISSAILIESSLSFLGLGVSYEQVTWGKMLNTARNSLSAWWVFFFPATMIFITLWSLNTIGQVLQNVLQKK